MKKCCRCKEFKEFSSFGILKSSKDGYRHDCKECGKLSRKIYYENNKESYLKRANDWKSKNKEKSKQITKNWISNNKERFRYKHNINARKHSKRKSATNAFRRAKKLQATPTWLTKEHKNIMTDFYKKCPKGYHVDHIIPLVSDKVCGLHVPWNLQYLTREDNIKKSNKLLTTHIETVTSPTMSSDIKDQAVNETSLILTSGDICS